MIRKAFIMKLFPENIDEYKARHQPIWKSLESVLKQHGVSNYSIFYNAKDYKLFGYVELESLELWNQIANTQVCKDWWTHMSDLMETYQDDSPVSFDLEEVFHLN